MKRLLSLLLVATVVVPAFARIKDRNVEPDAGIQASKISGGTFGDDENADGTTTNDFVFPDRVTVTGNTYFVAGATTGLVASTIIPSSSTFILVGATGNLVLSSVPNIGTTNAGVGQFIVVKSTNGTITLRDISIQSDSAVCLSSATLSITTSTPMSFIYDGTCWQNLIR